MEQTAPSPTPPSGRLQRISRPEPGPSACPRNGLRSVGPRRSCPNRNGESLLAVPGGGGLEGSKAGVLAELRHRITALERGSSLSLQPLRPACRSPASRSAWSWTLGRCRARPASRSGLDAASLHEVKAEPQATGVAAGNWAAALGFALRLRRAAPAKPRGFLCRAAAHPVVLAIRVRARARCAVRARLCRSRARAVSPGCSPRRRAPPMRYGRWRKACARKASPSSSASSVKPS